MGNEKSGYLAGGAVREAPIYYRGLLYSNVPGTVSDPERENIIASPGDWIGAANGGFALDEEAGVFYYSRARNYDRWIVGMHATTFTPVRFSYVSNRQVRMVYAGPGGLAGINVYGQLNIIPWSVIAPLEPETWGEPMEDPDGVRRVAIPNGCWTSGVPCVPSMTYDPHTDRLFVGGSKASWQR